MKTPIALHNLWHQGIKTAVSIGGVAFALLLVFMQLGFMGAVSHTATNLLENLKFDILIRARDYLHLYEPGQIDRHWLTIAESTDGVARATPFWITIQNWRTLPTRAQTADDFESQYLPIAVMAYEPQYCVFDLPQVAEQTELLGHDDAILLDDSTQPDYGPWLPARYFWEMAKFSSQDLGRDTEIGSRSYSIAGLFKLGTGLAANGALITSHRGFARITPWNIQTSTSIGLIELQTDDPIEKAIILERLRERLKLSSSIEEAVMQSDATAKSTSWWQQVRELLGAPPSLADSGVVDVISKEEALAREKYRWLWQTPFGLIFQMGVLLSLMVGAAIVYMVLSTDVANRLSEYATLLAMGYSRGYLSSIVMTQAVVLCSLGFLSAWGVAEVLYRITYNFSGIPLMMNPTRVCLVAFLGLFMCCLSGLLALRKLWKAEPASLF